LRYVVPELTPGIVDDVVAACQAGVAETAEAFSRALDDEITVAVGASGTIDTSTLPDDLAGAGLAVVLTVGELGALVLLGEDSGLVPAWCADPDPTGESKLATLAQELGMILLPEQFMPEDFKAARVKNLAGAMRRGGVDDGAAMVPLGLSSGEKQATARLIWPAPKPAAVVGSPAPKPGPTPPAEAPAPAQTPPAPQQPPMAAAASPQPKRKAARMSDLPPYTHSILRIKVPLVVTLAEKRQPLGRIVELGPGSIIQFEKSCEDMLDLDVGDHQIASGEAVKVGDKFGLRITSVKLPEERFLPVRPKQA